MGIALIYYLSLYGAWSVVQDKLGGDSGKHYDYIEAKLFTVALDDNYFYSLILYSGFVIALEIVLLLMIRPAICHGRSTGDAVRISHRALLLISFFSVLVSYLIISQNIANAEDVHKSAYESMVRGLGDVSPLFTIHQILLRISSTSAALGVVVYFCGDSARLILGDVKRWTGIGYALVIGMSAGLSFVAGYKSELFFPGVSGCLFYLVNAERPRFFRLGFMGLAVLMGMWMVDSLRYVPLSDLVAAVVDLKSDDLLGVFQFASSSNEAFFAHYSMFGVLANHVLLTSA